MAADDVIKLRYRKSEKKTPAHVLETICVKFHQHWPSRLGTDTQEDGQIVTQREKQPTSFVNE